MTGENRQQKLLFLAFSFPPQKAVSSVRSGSIVRQLSRIGWKISVVTPHPSLLKNSDGLEKVAAELGQLAVRPIYTGHRWRCLSSGHLSRSYRGPGWFAGGVCRWVARRLGISEDLGWLGEAYKACADLTGEDVDVILATGGPWGTFTLARRLAAKLQRPYVLDYRDLWTTGNPHVSVFSTRRNQRAERELLAGCAAVSVVSRSMALSLSQRFGVETKLHVISNGFDPADLERVRPFPFGHFAIVYAGRLVPPKGDLPPLLDALRRLEEMHPAEDWRFHYYGPDSARVGRLATAHGLTARTVVHGLVPRAEALSAVRGAGVAVVVTSVYDTATLGDRGILTGKLFEPIGLGTPTLAIAPPGSDIEEVIATAGTGRVFAGSNTGGMAAFLAELVRGEKPLAKNPQAYSWTNLISKMDTMLRQAARGER